MFGKDSKIKNELYIIYLYKYEQLTKSWVSKIKKNIYIL
jgi:hypothetical protein